MQRFLPGIILLQLVTVALTLLLPVNENWKSGLPLLISVLVCGLFVSFWFAAIARNKVQSEVSKTRESFVEEREKIQVSAERAKTRVVEKAQKQIASEARRTHGKANFKVGAAFAATIGAGMLFIAIELLTFGLMTLTTAGGAMGGYLVRARKAHRELKEISHQTNNPDIAPPEKLRLPGPSELIKTLKQDKNNP